MKMIKDETSNGFHLILSFPIIFEISSTQAMYIYIHICIVTASHICFKSYQIHND